MFKGGQPNPYDEIVAKTTDENLTSENWELILNLCDKVQDEGEQGARNIIAAILKRLTHRTSNVQLYTLTLAESLTKNCGIEVHREIASRAFTQGLERLILDRNTHDKVRKRALSLIEEWTGDFEKDPTLGIMEECYENLKGKGYKFETPNEPPPVDVDDEARRREEEELQRVLEMSMLDKGGRNQWSSYSLTASSGAGASSSSVSGGPPSSSRQNTAPQTQQPVYGGYVPSASPAVAAEPAPVKPTPSAAPVAAAASYAPISAASPVPSVRSQDSVSAIVTRVRALHTFEPTESGELAFEKGDIIKVVDRGYKDWWRGQLKGRTGIFPVNYVEPLPEPTAAELAKEAEKEAAVFAQAANVDRLLTMLRQMDPAKDNLADDEEIQELYRSCMTLRPKIVKLIDKYSQKRADLVSMNETFVKARSIFDRMMEDSLARHTAAGYDPRGYGQSPYGRPDARAPGPPEYPPQTFGWNPSTYDQPGYAAYPAAPAAYGHGPAPEVTPYGPGPQPQPYSDPVPYSAHPPQQGYPAQPGPYGAPPTGTPAPYGAPQPSSYPLEQHIQQQPPQQGVSPQTPHPQAQPQGQLQIQPQTQPQVQSQVQSQVQPQSPVQPQAQAQVQPQPQPQPQAQPEPQPQVHAQVIGQSQTQPQPQQEQPPSTETGPPYIYDPHTTYSDPNVQAWAQYYAQGGTDPTGALYFVSVPGVKEAEPAPPESATTAPLNVHHGGTPAGQNLQHGSPTAQHAVPTALTSQGIPYGSSPYLAQNYAGSPAPAQGGWGAQYQNLPGQFAGMSVGADGQPPQGVGASA